MKKLKTIYIPPHINLWTAGFLIGALAAIGFVAMNIFIAATLGITVMGVISWMGYAITWAFVVAFIGLGMAVILNASSPKLLMIRKLEKPKFTRKWYARR